MSTLSAVRTQLRLILNETDNANSHFTDAQLDGFINQAQTFMATYIEYPRTIASAQVTAGTADYTLPTDWISILAVYFGDLSISNDVIVLRIINEESLKTIRPGWLETASGSRGRPQFVHIKNRTTLTLIPTPDTDNATTGKKYHLNYIKLPTTLTVDSDIPELPLPYHDFLQFYAAHLCYLVLQVQAMADKMFSDFTAKMKAVQAEVSKESKEQMAWQWTYNEDVSGDSNGGISF